MTRFFPLSLILMAGLALLLVTGLLWPPAAARPEPMASPHSPLTGTRLFSATLSMSPVNTPAPTPTPRHISEMVMVDHIQTITVPILMYHYISSPPPGSSLVRQALSVPPAQFEAHLLYLREAGFETISLEHLALASIGEASLPPRPIVLSFDDGHRDHYTNAFPLLQKHGFSGTFFVFTLPIDQSHPDYLTWDMVTEMHQAGMEFGSHSYRHMDMRERDFNFLIYEILGSKEAIEARTGEPVRFFCYPAGRYDAATMQILDATHFWGAVTTQWGLQHSYDRRFEMPRLRIEGHDTAQHLANKLATIANP